MPTKIIYLSGISKHYRNGDLIRISSTNGTRSLWLVRDAQSGACVSATWWNWMGDWFRKILGRLKGDK